MQLPTSLMTSGLFGDNRLLPAGFKTESWPSSELFTDAAYEVKKLTNQPVEAVTPEQEITFADMALVGYTTVGEDPHDVATDYGILNGVDTLTDNSQVVFTWFYKESDATIDRPDRDTYMADFIARYEAAVIDEGSPVLKFIIERLDDGVVAVHELYASMADLETHMKMIGTVPPGAGEESLFPNTVLQDLYAELNTAIGFDINATHFGHNVDPQHSFAQYIVPFNSPPTVLPDGILGLVEIYKRANSRCFNPTA